jgi:hypothetical protein
MSAQAVAPVRCEDHLDLNLAPPSTRDADRARGFGRIAATFVVLQVGDRCQCPSNVLREQSRVRASSAALCECLQAPEDPGRPRGSSRFGAGAPDRRELRAGQLALVARVTTSRRVAESVDHQPPRNVSMPATRVRTRAPARTKPSGLRRRSRRAPTATDVVASDGRVQPRTRRARDTTPPTPFLRRQRSTERR